MKHLTVLLLITLSACGPHEVNVNHKIQLDMTNLTKYFESICVSEGATDVESCIDEKITEFLKLVL
jgi:hypothetical protein